MYLNSCLYPFAISLLAVLWLFITTASLSQNIKPNSYAIEMDSILKAYKQNVTALTSFALFLPSLWIYASFLSTKGAGDSGLIWLVASSFDTYVQIKCPNRKRWGYLIALLAIGGLWLGGAYGLFVGYKIHA